MYNPAMGIWTIRDPVQEGMNLYAYCGSQPQSRLDPYGLAYVTVTPLTGWYGETRLSVPGQTRWGSTVEATCQCTGPGKGKWQLVDVRAEVRVAITMNPGLVNGMDVDNKPLEPEGIIGHEQRHVNKVAFALDNLKGAVMLILEPAEFIMFETEKLCDKYLDLTLRPKVANLVNMAAEEAAHHAGDTSKTTEGGGYPLYRRQYLPESGSDISKKGERVPWDGDSAWRGNSVR